MSHPHFFFYHFFINLDVWRMRIEERIKIFNQEMFWSIRSQIPQNLNWVSGIRGHEFLPLWSQGKWLFNPGQWRSQSLWSVDNWIVYEEGQSSVYSTGFHRFWDLNLQQPRIFDELHNSLWLFRVVGSNIPNDRKSKKKTFITSEFQLYNYRAELLFSRGNIFWMPAYSL